MRAVEQEYPPGLSTRAASASTAARSSTSVEIHSAATVEKAPSPKGRTAAAAWTDDPPRLTAGDAQLVSRAVEADHRATRRGERVEKQAGSAAKVEAESLTRSE